MFPTLIECVSEKTSCLSVSYVQYLALMSYKFIISCSQLANTVTDFHQILWLFYLGDKAFKGDYISFCNQLAICFIQWPIRSQHHMLICNNLVVSVLYNIMWSIRKNVTHEAKGKIVHLFEPWWAQMPRRKTFQHVWTWKRTGKKEAPSVTAKFFLTTSWVS